MSHKKGSTRAEMHSYQNSEKLNPFWEFTDNRFWGYSEATKDYFRERAREFINNDSNCKKVTWTKRENLLSPNIGR